MWLQRKIVLPAKARGFHLIEQAVLAQLPEITTLTHGLLHLQLLHTSASLFITENADPDVRLDFETLFNRLLPEPLAGIRHTLEGSDDMPAHIKSALLGSSLTIAISQGQAVLGTWQGLCLGEHRNHGGERKIIATVHGE